MMPGETTRADRRWWIGAVALALAFGLELVWATSTAAAQRCPAMEGADAALADIDARERAAFLSSRAHEGYAHAATWTNVYSLSYLGIAAAQLGVLALSSDEGRRVSMAIGAASSLIGVASLFVLPLSILTHLDPIEEAALAAERGDCAALAELERLVADGASSEEFGRSWLVHVGSILFNLGVGLLLGLGYDEWVSGAISAGSGIAIGELQILTQPTTLSDAMAHYRAGELDGSREASMTARLGGAGAGAGLSLEMAF